jgi:hypothetical protein
VPLDGTVQADAVWHRPARAAAATLRLATGAVTLSGEGEVGWDAAGALERARTVFELPRTPCGAAFVAVPRPLRARLDGLELAGEIAGGVEHAIDFAHPGAEVLDLGLDVGCQVLQDAAAADPAALSGAFEHVFPDGNLRTLGPEGPEFVALGDLPHHVWAAFVAGEDARFFRHHGFDPVELRRSFAIDVAARRALRGGSTMSQQLVKNLFLTRERTFARKLMEAILTWRLEQKLGKRRILEIYLNLIELGEGVHGLGPAARRWFGKPPERLTVAEAAFLAALTPAPVSTDRRLRAAGARADAARRRVDAVLRSMRTNRLIDRETWERARSEPLRLRFNAGD